MIRYFLPLVLGFLGLAGAQEAPSASVRVLCFERDPSGLDRLSVVTADKKFEEIRFPESFPSRPVKVPLIKGTAYFYDPAKTEGKPVASAAIPGGMKKAYVMFFPAPPSEDGPLYRTIVLDASLKNIPEDGAMVMNIAAENLRVIIGEHKFLLKAGKSTGIQRPKKRNDYNMASVVFMREEEGEWKVEAETAVRFPEEQQQFFVAFPDPKRKRIQIRAYDLSEY